MSNSKVGNKVFGLLASAAVAIALFSISQPVIAAGRIKSTTTSPLKISGTAPTSVVAGSSYSFTPNANGGGTTKTFSISNKPAWASFSISSGKLTGIPTVAQVGTYSNVTILVTDGLTTAKLSPFSVAVTAPATSTSTTTATTTTTVTGSAALTWSPPTQNTDGTALVDLAGYAIYYGTSPTSLTNRIVVANAGATSFTVSNLPAGTYYFGLAAYTAAGVESALSSIGSKTIN